MSDQVAPPIPKRPQRPTGQAPTAAKTPPPVPMRPAQRRMAMITSPDLGLTRSAPTTAKTTTSPIGSGTEHENTHVMNDAGMVTGTSDQTTHGRGRGSQMKSEYSHKRFDGTTQTELTSETEAMAGVQAQIKLLTIASAREKTQVIELMARAGAFGEAAQTAAFKRRGIDLRAQANQSFGAGLIAEAKGMLKMDRSGLVPAIEQTFEASIKAGVWVDASLKADAKIGPMTMALLAEFSAMAGAEAQFKSNFFASLKEGIGGSFAASGFAGAKVSAKGSFEMGLPQSSLQVSGEMEGAAGAGAEVSGSFSVHLTGVSAQFKAAAWAGAKFDASGSASLKIMGKQIVSAKGKISVSVGVGGEVEGEFEIKNGRFKVSAELGGALGFGGGAGAALDIDFASLGQVVCAKIGDLAADEKAISDKSPDYERPTLTDPAAKLKQTRIGHDAVYDDFLAYGNKKSLQGASGVKLKRVQDIIDNVAPLMRRDFAYQETDRGIEQAAMEAFKGQLISIVVNAGKIRGFQPVAEEALAKHKQEMTNQEQWRRARDGLAKDIDAYAGKKANGGSNGVKREKVQQIIDSHWAKLQKAFPGAEADQVIMFAAQNMKESFLDDFIVSQGQIRAFGVSAAKTSGVKAATKQAAVDQKTAAGERQALASVRGELGAYRAKLLRTKGSVVTLVDLQKVLDKGLKSAPKSATGSQFDSAVASAITEVMDPIVSSVEVKDGKAGRLVVMLMGINDSKAQAALESFQQKLEAYKEEKTSGGKQGAKVDRVQEMLTKSFALAGSWLDTDTGSEQVAGVIREVFGTWVTSVIVSGGMIRNLQFDKARMAEAKADRKRDGKTRLEAGEANDNTRRKMIADGVRAGFSGYIGELRAAAKKDPASPKAKVSAVRLQKVINEGLKSVRADVNNDVGDQALITAIKDKFPMVTELQVSGLTIRSLDADYGFWTAAEARRVQSARVSAAMQDLVSDLRTAGPKATRKLVQMAVDRYRAEFAGLDASEQDELMSLAIHQALGATAEKVTLVDGKVSGL